METIGDAYEVVSGAPIASKFHAVYAADMAGEMIEAMNTLADPSRPGESLKIRLGMCILSLKIRLGMWMLSV